MQIEVGNKLKMFGESWLCHSFDRGIYIKIADENSERYKFNFSTSENVKILHLEICDFEVGDIITVEYETMSFRNLDPSSLGRRVPCWITIRSKFIITKGDKSVKSIQGSESESEQASSGEAQSSGKGDSGGTGMGGEVVGEAN